MVEIIDRAIQLSHTSWECLCSSIEEIKTGILTFFSADGTYILWRIYSLEGLERWNRAFLSNLEFLILFPKINAVFEKCRWTCEAQRDLYYTTLAFASLASFTKKNSDGKPIGVQLPHLSSREGGGLDWALLSLCISSAFEVAQFLKKYQVCEFAFYSKYVTPMGNYGYLNQIPVVQSLFDGKPKEFFIVTASLIGLYRTCIDAWQLWHVEQEKRDSEWTVRKWITLLNFVSRSGTALGISSYRKFGGQVWLAVLNVVCMHTPLFKFMLETHHNRKMRDEFPEVPII